MRDNFKEKKYTLDDAFNLIYEATENLGAAYKEVLDRARDEK